MNTTHGELLARYLAGQTSAEENAAFELALKNERELRALYLDHLNLETALEAQAGAVYGLLDFPTEIPAQPTRSPWFQSRQLMSAAAGLIIGLFSASVVFGYVIPLAAKTLTLLNEGFESGSAPLVTGMPVTTGVWSGDFTELVSSQQGITPVGGKKMLRFLRADYQGKAPQLSYSGDIYRVIDVREQATNFVDGKSLMSVEANFRTVPVQEAKRFQCGIEIHALDVLPDETQRRTWNSLLRHPRGADAEPGHNATSSGEGSLASASRQFMLDSAGGSWQKFRSELRVPPGTQYLLIAFHVIDLKAAKERSENYVVEFPGQYMDNVEVSLIRSVPIP